MGENILWTWSCWVAQCADGQIRSLIYVLLPDTPPPPPPHGMTPPVGELGEEEVVAACRSSGSGQGVRRENENGVVQ